MPGDDFTGTAGTNLHTASSGRVPTGTDAGTSWIVWNGAVAIDSSGRAQGNSASAGNRAIMSDDLGSNQMSAYGEFTSAAGTGQSTFQGLFARAPATTGLGIEFTYDHGVNQWVMDTDGASVSLSEAWPGGVVKMQIICSNKSVDGYANGVLKVSQSLPGKIANTRAGILLGSFGGPFPTCDNFVALALREIVYKRERMRANAY